MTLPKALNCRFQVEKGEAGQNGSQPALAAGIVGEGFFNGLAKSASIAEKSLSLDRFLCRYRFLSKTGFLQMGHSQGKRPRSGKSLLCRKLSRTTRRNLVPHLLQYISALPHRLTAKFQTGEPTVLPFPEATGFNL
jgi:hypothetical protein